MQAKNKYLPFAILFLIVLLSRFPFLNAGYGVEEDSWGIALAAFHTKLTGIYEPSRFPGHPVQELIYSALWGSGPFIFNLLSALFSAIAALFFALILKHFNFKNFFLAALAFAFVPVVYISSTYTIDFMWSVAFVLMSLYFLLKEKHIVCGLLLGLAVGCRITCGVMLLPYMIIVWENNNPGKNLKFVLRIALPMLTLAFFVFLPLILQFGTSFFMYYDQFPYPPFAKVVYKMTIGVFGLIGCIAILIMALRIIFKKERAIISVTDKRIVYASVCVIVLYCISYFRLPQKSGYLIPLIPFVIILFEYYLNLRQFRYLCYAFIISSFILSINLTDKLRGASYSEYALKYKISGQEIFLDFFPGPVFSDLSKRLQKMNYTDEVIKRVDNTHSKTVIISGWWYNEIMVTLIDKRQNSDVIFEPYIQEQKMENYISENYSIVYLPEQNVFNDQMYKITSTDSLSKPF